MLVNELIKNQTDLDALLQLIKFEYLELVIVNENIEVFKVDKILDSEFLEQI